MKQLLFSILLYIYLINKSIGQSTLLIHQVGLPTDTIFVANYGEEYQPQIINDSTYKLNWNTLIPERICLFLDRPTRWWVTIWIEPDILNKEIVIDYSQKEVRLINGSEWDSVCLKWMGKFPYHTDQQTDSIAIGFVEKNPNSYLSLFFLTHGLYRENSEKKRTALNKLSEELKNYPEFKQAMANLNERKFPSIGDTFKEFTLTDKNDYQYNSNIINNKWILLNFWSNTCGPCIKELDEFAAFYSSVDSSKVEFISIALDEDKTKWRNAKATDKITWINLWTPNNFYCDLCLNYNLYSMPFFILFDNEKKLFYIKDGAGELENIKSTLKEKDLLKK